MAIKQVFIGFTTEGTTDVLFLQKIVERTFEEIAYECYGDVEPFVKYLKIDKTDLSFDDYILKASRQGVDEIGMMILCVHSDADDASNDNTVNYKIIPAQTRLANEPGGDICKVLVALIPVQMMESWMLADKELLKREIGTTKSDAELQIDRFPESISDPKSVIEGAIRIARQEITKRRRKKLTIDDIYLPVGQKISIEKLKALPSYLYFQEEVRKAYRKLNLMP